MRIKPSNIALTPPKFAPKFASTLAFTIGGLLSLSAGSAFAADFVINGNSNTAQTLGPAAGETGTVTAGSTLSVSGSTNAVTITGNNARVENQGTITQTGNGRVIRDNTGVSGLMIVNGSLGNSSALLQSADSDVIQMNRPTASVEVINHGQMTSLNASAGGSQVIDFAAITSGSNIVTNLTTGVMTSYEADAVRLGVNGVLNNAGTIQAITAVGAGSDGVDLQTNNGAQILNNGLISGRHGITGEQANAAVIYNANITNFGTIRGTNGAGLNFDAVNGNQTVTVINHGSILGNGVLGDGDGVDVDGLVNINNTGLIRSANAVSEDGVTPAQSEGISAGGGTIVNSGTIEGLVAPGNPLAVGRGISLLGNDAPGGGREPLYGNAVITNLSGGTIRGQGDSAIAVDGPASGFTVVINNNAGGLIIGGGAGNAAIRTGADNDTIVNAGTINGSTNGRAIDMGGGNNSLFINGGSAVVLGNINGGSGGINTMTINPGAGNTFNYAGAISNFNQVRVLSGRVVLSGISDYTGTTLLSGGTLALDGAGRLSADSSLALDGGMLEVINAAGVDAQTFFSFSLLDDSSIDLNGAFLTFNGLGTVADDASLTVLDFIFDDPSDYAFRFLGDVTDDADFLALIGDTTINGRAVRFWFDGVYTDISVVSEPGSLALLFTSLGLLATVARRRKQNAA